MHKENMILHWEAFMKHRADGCEQLRRMGARAAMSTWNTSVIMRILSIAYVVLSSK